MNDSAKIELIIRNRKHDSVVDILLDVQEQFGFISRDVMNELSRKLMIPESKIYSLITFNNRFRTKKFGKYHFKICNGTNCHIKGSGKLIEQLRKKLKLSHGGTTNNGMFSLELSPCMDSCSAAPSVSINDMVFIDIDLEKLDILINACKEDKLDDVPFK